MRKTKQTQSERIGRLENVVSKLYFNLYALQKEVKELQTKNKKDETI